MPNKLLISLENYARHRWQGRWFAKEVHFVEITDIMPLIDFATSLFEEFMADKFFRMGKEAVRTIRSRFRDAIRKVIDKTHSFSEDQLAKIEAEVLISLLPALERERLEGGIRILSSYDEVRTVVGTEMRWRIIRALSRKPMTAKQLSKAIPEAREEAIRRAVEQMVKIEIVKIGSRLVEGRAVKEYELTTPVLIIDLR